MKALTWFLGLGQSVQAIIGAVLLTVIAGQAAVIAGGIVYHRSEVADAEKKYDALVQKDARCEGEAGGLRSSHKTITDAAKTMVATSERMQLAGKQAIAAAEKQAENHRQTALAILSAKPEDAANLCESARILALNPKGGKK